MIFDGIKLKIDTAPLSIDVSIGVFVNFTHNPELEFDLEGIFTPTGSVEVTGDMLGTWENMFGIKGLDISNVVLAMAFNPNMCEVDFICLSGIGLGYNLTVGSEDIAMYGYVELPDFEKLFISSSISGKNGFALTLRDIGVEFNRLVGPTHIHVNIDDIPANWGILDTSFYVAPEAGEFGGIYYEQGFDIVGGLEMFDIVCDVNISVINGDFDFRIHIGLEEFKEWLKKELHVMDPAANPDAVAVIDRDVRRPIVEVVNVQLLDFSMAAIAEGNDPRFVMDYYFIGNKEHHFEVKLPLIELVNDFHTFYKKWLEKLFHIDDA
jgi:hypothetical protein